MRTVANISAGKIGDQISVTSTKGHPRVLKIETLLPPPVTGWLQRHTTVRTGSVVVCDYHGRRGAGKRRLMTAGEA